MQNYEGMVNFKLTILITSPICSAYKIYSDTF